MGASHKNYAEWERPDNKRAHTLSTVSFTGNSRKEKLWYGCTVTEGRPMAAGDGRVGRGERRVTTEKR